jgi:hypothetical protein
MGLFLRVQGTTKGEMKMKKMLIKVENKIYRIVDGEKINGRHSGICGDVSGICGNVSGIYGNVSGIYGDVSWIRGDVSGIRGNVSGIYGDVSGIRGDVDECELTEGERQNGININELIEQ